MTIHVHHWDVFTHQSGKGNPAGIVLSAQGLTDHDMQAIAAHIGFNDTAFVLPSQHADFRIRYFAPRREVDLCGHATIAAFAALHRSDLLNRHADNYTLETNTGVLPIRVTTSNGNAPLVVMTQGIAQFANFSGEYAVLARAIGISTSDIHPTLPIMYGSTGRWTLLVPVKNLDAMRRMRPTPNEFAAVLTDIPDASIHPFCLQTVDPHANAHARHFSSPTSGTIEDPVTGTASGVLGAYYRRFIDHDTDNESPLLIEQGYEIGRNGEVQVWATKHDNDYSARIAGSACFVRDIELTEWA